MNQHNEGDKPNNGDSTHEGTAQDHNNNAAVQETANSEYKPQNAKPDEAKKKRKSDSERLIALRLKRQAALETERKLKARVDLSLNKEMVRLKIVLGVASLNLIRSYADPGSAKKTVDTLHKWANEADKAWLNEHYDRLVQLYVKPKANPDGANGSSPSPS